MEKFASIPADIKGSVFFFPDGEYTTLAQFHAAIKKHVLKGEDKAQVKEFLKYQRWMPGGDINDPARVVAEAIYKNFKAYYK